MRIRRIKVRNAQGRLVTATEITTRKTRFVAFRRLSLRKIRALVARLEPGADTTVENWRSWCKKNPDPDGANSVPGLKRSVRRFREFNRRSPRHLRQLRIPDDAPLIRIGKVPIVTYISSKTGRRQAYKHTTNPRSMPTAYGHPTKPFILLVGGTLKVRDWLYH